MVPSFRIYPFLLVGNLVGLLDSILFGKRIFRQEVKLVFFVAPKGDHLSFLCLILRTTEPGAKYSLRPMNVCSRFQIGIDFVAPKGAPFITGSKKQCRFAATLAFDFDNSQRHSEQ